MISLFAVKYESSEELSMEMIMSGGDPEMIERIYNNGNYRKAIQQWLPFLDNRGFLDVLIKPQMEKHEI